MNTRVLSLKKGEVVLGFSLILVMLGLISQGMQDLRTHHPRILSSRVSSTE